MVAASKKEPGQKKTRIPQAVRSAKMRERLSKAAFDVIHQVGYDNFRTSAVSREAGVSQGAQLHHFPTKDSLAIAAMEYAYTTSETLFWENFEITASGEDLITLILKDFQDFYLSDYFQVALDILMACNKNQDLRDELTEMALHNRRTVERKWLERLIDDGWPLSEAEDVLALSHSIVRGFSIRGLVKKDSSENQQLLYRWKNMINLLKINISNHRTS